MPLQKNLLAQHLRKMLLQEIFGFAFRYIAKNGRKCNITHIF